MVCPPSFGTVDQDQLGLKQGRTAQLVHTAEKKLFLSDQETKEREKGLGSYNPTEGLSVN